MFRKTKIKIVVVIMSVLVLLWAATNTVIYISYVSEISKNNYEMLAEQAHQYVSESFLDEEPPEMPDTGKPSIADKAGFALTTFYTVAFSDDGETFETMNDKPTVRSNEELEELAKRIVLEYDNDIGVERGLIFYHINKGSYDLVVFMDDTLLFERASTLFRYIWIYSAGAFVCFLLLAIISANIIVRPLEKSYENQKRFVSDAGHELKTPVSVISANTELLSRKIGDNQWLSNIQYENERMGVLVGHLLELARSESVPSSMEYIDFSKLVKGEALPFESVAYEKGLTLNCDIAQGINVYGNSTQLKHVVSVLLDNAIYHCNNESSEIKLQLRKASCRYAKLCVINSGKEIPKEEHEKIFERFYRVNTARDGNDKHYGLGLAIAKNIVTSHKGKIQILCYNGKVEFQVLIPLNKISTF